MSGYSSWDDTRVPPLPNTTTGTTAGTTGSFTSSGDLPLTNPHSVAATAETASTSGTPAHPLGSPRHPLHAKTSDILNQPDSVVDLAGKKKSSGELEKFKTNSSSGLSLNPVGSGGVNDTGNTSSKPVPAGTRPSAQPALLPDRAASHTNGALLSIPNPYSERLQNNSAAASAIQGSLLGRDGNNLETAHALSSSNSNVDSSRAFAATQPSELHSSSNTSRGSESTAEHVSESQSATQFRRSSRSESPVLQSKTVALAAYTPPDLSSPIKRHPYHPSLNISAIYSVASGATAPDSHHAGESVKTHKDSVHHRSYPTLPEAADFEKKKHSAGVGAGTATAGEGVVVGGGGGPGKVKAVAIDPALKSPGRASSSDYDEDGRKMVRIGIRWQLAALVIIASLIGLAVVTIATWVGFALLT
jgi:hypothetical protein